MSEEEKKQYVLNSFKTDNGKRITLVLDHYWKDLFRNRDIVQIAKKIFITDEVPISPLDNSK